MMNSTVPPRRCVAAAALFAFAALCAGANEYPPLHNDRVSISFDSAGNLVDLVDHVNGHDFIDSGAGGLWHLAFDGGRSIIPADAARMDLATENERTTLIWRGFTAPGLENMRIMVTVTLADNSATSEWSLLVKGLGDARLEEARFPILGDILEQPGEILAAPIWMGEAATDPRTTLAGEAPVSGKTRACCPSNVSHYMAPPGLGSCSQATTPPHFESDSPCCATPTAASASISPICPMA
jgi:hypothetical protein